MSRILLSFLLLAGCAQQVIYINPDKTEEQIQKDMKYCDARVMETGPAMGGGTFRVRRARESAREISSATSLTCMKVKGYVIQPKPE